MGQLTVGIMYGTPVPETLADKLYGEPEENGLKYGEGFLEAWNKRHKVKLRTNHEADIWLMGFWVCVHRSDRDDIPEMGTFELDSLQTDQVEKAWQSLHAWAAERGIDLPKPSLWISETEVA